ncbi:hypothetical protein NO1_2003 [Candidatus Termititenax aidoneus]|uniref:Phage tail fiber protein n=1 Tax=Termititenax aidoneus TaxID=2218524 RepID=A0A388TDA8_TERA1|nr:hypothetical protein NO1_2003 [Candidatus Termititenax aidoneus]
MADNYTDTTDQDFTTGNYNIATGKNLSAAGVRNALHTKENVANKTVTVDSSSTDAQYPSAKAVYGTVNTGLSAKQNKIAAGIANDIVAYSGTAGTFGTLTRTTTLETNATSASDDKIPTEKAVATALDDKESTSNKATSISDTNKDDAVKYPTIGAVTTWAESTSNKATSIIDTNKSDTTKYPTIGAVTAWADNAKQDKLTAAQLTLLDSLSTLSFFPKGTILPITSMAWDEASTEFKKVWKICDGAAGSGTINLVGKFIRGGAYADYGTTGGTDTAQVPRHAHKHKHADHTGELHSDSPGTARGGAPLYGSGVFTSYTKSMWSSESSDNISGSAVNFKASHNEDETYAGVENADNRPVFYTLIFIQKVV